MDEVLSSEVWSLKIKNRVFFSSFQLGKARVKVIGSDCYTGILVPNVKIREGVGKTLHCFIIYLVLSIKLYYTEEKQRSLAFAQTHQ